MWRNILWVGAGSFVGGAMRYAVSLLMKYSGGFPWATFIVNLLGGFTTFSTFSKESLLLIQSGNWICLALYVAGSVVLGLLLVATGYQIVK